MQKKVCIVSYDMIPYTQYWGGCQRMFFLADELSNQFEVTVCCAEKNNTGTFGQKVRFNTLAIPFNNKFIQKFVNKKNTPVKSSESVGGKTKKGLPEKIIRSIDHFFFNEPNPGMGAVSSIWANNALPALIKHIKEQSIRCIVLTAPPFGVFNLVKPLKQIIPGLKVILDYRDPWNLWKKGNAAVMHKEKASLKLADKVITTNKPLADALAAEFDIDRVKFEVISNGYAESVWSGVNSNVTSDNKDFTISYIGSINFGGYRNPDQFFKAFEHFTGFKNSVLRFIGVSLDASAIALKERFGDRIQFVEKIPHQESLREMLQSDVLLNFHTVNDSSAKYLVSAKVYDYIRSGKKILSVGPEEALTNRILLENGLGLVAPDQEGPILNTLENLYSLWKEKKLNRESSEITDKTSQFSREFQNKKYANIIKDLTAL